MLRDQISPSASEAVGVYSKPALRGRQSPCSVWKTRGAFGSSEEAVNRGLPSSRGGCPKARA